ncbi:response regulator transcription factor [Limnohabitans sp. Rim8]|uniref:response regulator transcription factor n=1 Tax=Limnohabitans sp. Rim8 TaxID=1100718 RepID=UPI00260917E0|nr:response regulator transcription factor [Limnohabitans sp. Rim8]
MLPHNEPHCFAVALLEDDLDFADQLTKDLIPMNCQVSHFHTGEDCLEALEKNTFDICLFDLQLPSISGLEVMTRLRTGGQMPLVIFLTSNDNEAEIEHTLLAGADDYIIKPHNPNILKASIRALLRRTRSDAAPFKEQLGALTIDHSALRIFLNDQPVNLTSMETTLAFALLRRRGQIVSRQTLNQTLNITDMAVDTRRLDVHLSRLRSKLALNITNGWKLSSIYRRGYRIEYFNEK